MNDQRNNPNGFWRRLGRAFVNLLKIVAVLVILALIAVGVWVGIRELQRSLGVVAGRGDVNAQRLETVRLTLEAVVAGEARVTALEADAATLHARVGRAEDDLGGDIARQQRVLDDLRAQLAALETESGSQKDAIGLLQEGIVTLQQDITADRRELDTLGGELDAVRLDFAELDQAFIQVHEDAGQLAEMKQALMLFRIWELVARARLRLADGNAGLAASDVDAALASADQLLASADDVSASAAALTPLLERLTLARANLPEEPEAAVRDLETAWELLDAQLIALLDLAPLEVGTPVPAQPATPAPSATP